VALSARNLSDAGAAPPTGGPRGPRGKKGPGSLLRKLGVPAVLLGQLLVTFPLVLFLLPVWFLPLRPAILLARFYAHVVCTLWPSARRVAMINLRRAYGEAMTYDEAARITRSVFCNLGQSLAEGLQFARRSGAGRSGGDYLSLIEDQSLTNRILQDPRPKIYVTGHIGSWEVAMMAAGRKGGTGSGAIIRRVDNPFVNWLVRRVRLDTGSQWIEKKGAVRECLARLQEGHSIAMLLDENGYRHGPFVEFFGRPAATQKTAALLALETGALVVVGGVVRSSIARRLRSRLVLIDPTSYSEKPSAIVEITQEITRVFEGWIREDPSQWCWIHWRWKHRPDGSIETYTRSDLRRCFS